MSARIEQFICRCFTPTIYFSHTTKLMGCGATALSLLTGADPFAIKHYTRNWVDSFMVRFLRKRGYKTLKLTPELVTDYPSVTSPVTKSHILLVSQHYNRKEASWAVINNGMYYHNFETYEMIPLELVNHPVITSYLVSHEKWR